MSALLSGSLASSLSFLSIFTAVIRASCKAVAERRNQTCLFFFLTMYSEFRQGKEKVFHQDQDYFPFTSAILYRLDIVNGL